MKDALVLRFVASVTIEETPPEGPVLMVPGGRVALADVTPGVRAVLERLSGRGAPEGTLVEIARVAENEWACAQVFYHLHRFAAQALLRYTLPLDDAPLMTLSPMSRAFALSLPEVEGETLTLSRFACIRLEDESLVLESPRAHGKILCHDRRLVTLVHALSTPTRADHAFYARHDLPEAVVVFLLRVLVGQRLVLPVTEGETEETRDEALAQWAFHDLLFHARSRAGRSDRPAGKTFPHLGKIEPLPAIKAPPSTSQPPIALHRPSLDALDCTLNHALEARQSWRAQDHRRPITAEQLGAFLFRTARVREVRPVSPQVKYETSSRPYPGGGGCYELELYLAIHHCDGLKAGLYYYHPLEHCLYRLSGRTPEHASLVMDAAFATASAAPPQVVINIAARFQRMAWSYEGIVYATTLKNVGVMMQTMYLVATAMDLAPCAMGRGDADLFARAASTVYMTETTVGEFMLGSRWTPEKERIMSKRVTIPNSARSVPAQVIAASVDAILTVHVHLRSRAPLDLEGVAAHRVRLSRAEFIAQHGASDEDICAVEAFAAAHGLTVTDRKPAWRIVTLEGAADAFNAAFGVDLVEHEEQGQKIQTHQAPVSVPEDLGGIIEWVFGLHHRGFGPWLKRTQSTGTATEMPSGAAPSASDPVGEDLPPNFFPSTFARLYDFPDVQGEGECVGVLELLGGYKASDMETFFAAAGVAPTLHDVGPNVWAMGDDYWSNYEVTMDTQIVASIVPKATVVVYFSGAMSGDEVDWWHYLKVFCMALFDTEYQPTVLTLSAGLPENLPGIWTKPEAEIVNGILAAAAAMGVTVCLPTGDSGSVYPTGTMMFNAPSIVYFPSSSPWCVSCGGTSLQINGDDEVVDETVWNNLGARMWLGYNPAGESSGASHAGVPYNLGAGGGGVSSYWPRPAYQDEAQVPPFETLDFVNWSFSNPQSFDGRGTPDIVANADFLYGYLCFIDGDWRWGGGTSASTPLLAAMFVCINQRLGVPVGFVTPHLYEIKRRSPDVFHEVLGDNGGFHSRPDQYWNPAAGLGSPRGDALAEALIPYYTPVPD